MGRQLFDFNKLSDRSTGKSKCKKDITACVPQSIYNLHDREIQSGNCFNLALNFSELMSSYRLVSEPEFHNRVSTLCEVIPYDQPPIPGDIIADRNPQFSAYFDVGGVQEVHAMIYLSRDLVWSKNSIDIVSHPLLRERGEVDQSYFGSFNPERCSTKNVPVFDKDYYTNWDGNAACCEIIRCNKNGVSDILVEFRSKCFCEIFGRIGVVESHDGFGSGVVGFLGLASCFLSPCFSCPVFDIIIERF